MGGGESKRTDEGWGEKSVGGWGRDLEGEARGKARRGEARGQVGGEIGKSQRMGRWREARGGTEREKRGGR